MTEWENGFRCGGITIGILICLLVLILSGCAEERMNNNEIIIEVRKCEAAGLRAVMLTDAVAIECRPHKEKRQ